MSNLSRTILTGLLLFCFMCLVVYYKGEQLLATGPTTYFTNYFVSISRPDSASSETDYYVNDDDNISFYEGSPTIKRQDTEYNFTEVITTCEDFPCRVREYNIAINLLRNETLRSRTPPEWHGAVGGTSVSIIWGAKDDFLQRLGKFVEIQTVSLPWLGDRSSNWSSLTDKSNLLIQNYYEWTASDLLCKWVETPGKIKMKYDVTFNRTCSRYMNNTAIPQSLKPVFLHMKPVDPGLYWPNNGQSFPAHFYQNTTQYVFYIHIVPDAIVTDLGYVYTSHVNIVPYSCHSSGNSAVPIDVNKRPLYDEVFVIAQYWGTAVFHRMCEIVPRLAGWIPFLKQNSQIKILANEKKGGRLGEILKILGLDPNRLVTEWGRAKVAYIPRASHCGMPSLQESQIVSSIYRRHIENYLGAQSRRKILLIKRSGWRRFTEHLEIEKILQKLAKENGLTYELFVDNPVPSLSDTMRMFHSAVMVVAPHGAGLSNIYFSQPGTYIIEGVCNLPHVNFCFQRLAVILGHHWHGIPSRRGCEAVVDVSAKDIEIAAKTYLQLYKAEIEKTST